MEEELFICTCHSLEHQVIFWKDNDDGEVYINVHLSKHGFFRRLVHGIKYIFGYSSRYGNWDEFIFKPEDLKKLKEFLDEEISKH